MSYTLTEIRLAAYNWEALPDMTQTEKNLWMGLGYCYEWYRAHPEDKKKCDDLAKEYIRLYGNQR